MEEEKLSVREDGQFRVGFELAEQVGSDQTRVLQPTINSVLL